MKPLSLEPFQEHQSMYILVVEDDASVARFLVRGLREEGYTVDLCDNGADALSQGARQSYDLYIVDWMLPDLDGVSVIRGLRERGVHRPILMLTARESTNSIVTALDAGADDYMSKPFSFEELLARMRALVRRSTKAEDVHAGRVEIGSSYLRIRERLLVTTVAEHELSNKEFSLLDLLIHHRGEVVGRTRILDRVWGLSSDPSTNVVDVYIRYLRSKLQEAEEINLIETVRGRGYKLISQQEYEDQCADEHT